VDDRGAATGDGVKEGDVSASYKDGILEIRVPVAAEEEKPPGNEGSHLARMNPSDPGGPPVAGVSRGRGRGAHVVGPSTLA
jgi:hypothetical protein